MSTRSRHVFAFALLVLAGTSAAREDVVFVLGADQPDSAPFLEPAVDHYRLVLGDAAVHTEQRSLAGVREWLQHHRGDAPFGRVILVAHGGANWGLDVPLFDDVDSAGLGAMRDATTSGAFPALADDVLDGDSVIVLESCGVGARADYLKAVAALFGGDGARPRIDASAWQVGFRVQRRNGSPSSSERFERRATSATTRFAPAALDADARVHWARRLGQQLGLRDDELPVLRMRPIEVLVDVPTDTVGDPRRLRRALRAHPGLRVQLDDIAVSPDDLAWHVSTVQPSGDVRVIGTGTLLTATRAH